MLAWILGNTAMAAGLALVIALVCRLYRSRPAFCHLLWLLALAALVMPPLPLGAYRPGQPLRQGITRWVGSEAGDREAADTRASEPAGATTAAATVEPAAAESPPAASTRSRAGSRGGIARWLLSVPLPIWALVVWSLGAGLIAGRMQFRILSFHRTVRRAPPAPRELRRSVAAVARRLNIPPPEVRLLEGVGCPSVWCLGRPLLLWPIENEPFRLARREPSLIAHELAHLARRDHCRAPDIGAWSGGIGRMPFIHDEGVRHKVCNALTGAAIDTDQGASPTRRFPAEP